MQIASLDHLVLTVRDLDAAIAFYVNVLGMEAQTFGEGRRALAFGSQKINLHVAGREFEPKAAVATPGSADLCFLTNDPLDEVIKQLQKHDVAILQGPVPRTGATGKLMSVYVRDPDGNLIEIANRATDYVAIRGHQPDFLVRYRFFTPEEGGRKSLPFQHIRCDWGYESSELQEEGIYMIWPEFLTSDGSVLPETSEVPMTGLATMWILVPEMRAQVHLSRIREGVRGFFMEGSKRTAEAVVVKVLGLPTNPTA